MTSAPAIGTNLEVTEMISCGRRRRDAPALKEKQVRKQRDEPQQCDCDDGAQ
jgi:hypothetical protein